MIKVVIDTNIIISAAISSEGNPAQIFEMLIQGEITNYTTKEIKEEIKRVLARPKIGLNQKEQEFIRSSYEEYSITIEKISQLDIVKDDPDDNKFIECAFDSQADYIISGDNHLLNLGEFKGIKILTPSEFIKTNNIKVSHLNFQT